jgi:hypothetical protein
VAGLQQLEFFLLRYAGDATKGESINLGVVAIAPQNGSACGFADVRFIRNWRRLHCFDPLSDAEEVQAIEREIRRDLEDPKKRSDLLKRLNDSWSNLVRFDYLQGCLTESPALEMERLSAIYLETPRLAERRDLTGRQRILQVMRDELQKAGVLQMMRTDVAEAEFTQPGNPFTLDFGYEAGNDYKFMHAVSLAHRLESGMMLAARFPKLAAGIQEKKGGKAWLTAVVDDDLPKDDEVDFTLRMMRDSGIVIAPVTEMSRIGESIRLELKA